MTRMLRMRFVALGAFAFEDRAVSVGAVTFVSDASLEGPMNAHVLVEWRDPAQSYGLGATFARAASLAREGQRVIVILIRDSVPAAARGEHTFWFAELRRLGVDVIADLASLRARDIPVAKLSLWVTPRVITLSLDSLVEEPDVNGAPWNAFGPWALSIGGG